jgi:serine/threonine protein kinase/Tol biopolymer transport system component
MGLRTGTQLGPYEILSAIGAGGMGEVYRARDTRLNRDVALKILPEIFAADPDRMARFEREARVLAALNHPHIAAIYGLEESGSTRALVMELLEGPTLADRTAVGAIPLDEALPIAKQIAEALEYAHDRGVIHRDLKPSNIKVTTDGNVKVLDFGLAKALQDEPMAADPRDSPTLSMAATMPGVILGTAAYMSPEQAKGKPVDRRADIWAFGVVLFEMLTGKPLYSGDTVAETLASIIKEDPRLDRLPSGTPPTIGNLLRRCLEKDPRQRLRDIGEARIVIEDVLSGTAPAEPVAPLRHRPFVWIAIAAVLFLTTVVLASVLIYDYRSPVESAAVRFFVSAPDKTSFESGVNPGIAGFTGGSISPNGRRLAFTAKDESGKVMLWVRSLDTLAAQPLPGTEGAGLPFWSPDTRSIGFFAQGKLKKINVEGGPPQTLCDAPNGRGGSWNRDGVIVFAPNNTSPLNRVPSAGGEVVAVTKVMSQQTGHRFPSFLPDGKNFLYFAAPSVGVFIGSLDSVDGQRLLAADSPAVYAPPGYVLFIRQGTLLAQPFDAKKLHLNGEPVPIAEQVASDGPGEAFSVSENGALAYRTGAGTANLHLMWVDRNGKLIESIGVPGGYLGPDLSPDGKRVAVHRHESTGGDIWLVEASGGKTSRLTFDASQENASPIWSPDGSRIAFGSRRNGKWGIYQKLSNGTGNEELLVESELVKTPISWSPDGKFILYMVIDPKTGSDGWALPLTGDRKPFPILQTPFNEGHPQISPDGKWIAYSSNETGRSEIYIQSFPPGAGKWQISSNGGSFARWRRDGKELFYMDSPFSGKMVSVEINASGSTVVASVPRPLFDSGYLNLGFGHTGNWNTYAVSADGQRFLIPRPEANLTGALTNIPITVVLNWISGLKK